MSQNDKKDSNNKSGGNGNWRGIISLVCWALLLTTIISYASTYMTSAGHQASSVEIYYSDFLDMVDANKVTEVNFDPTESILIISPKDGYVYTNKDGVTYTKGKDGFAYKDKDGKTQTIDLKFFTVELPNEQLVGYLQDHNVKFGETYEPPMSPILVFMINFILPFALIFLMFS
ncbi:MAG: ATP-dependent metallopeptidase FtsH/Yme1/Tma family protein, partial [Oscillibacter sp.]